MPPLQYECVVCTRNRPGPLRLSIPRLLGQTRPPRRVIVVDSSDDPAQVRALVDELAEGAPCELMLIHTAPGLTRQRNEGLALVEAEVVLFPDDDALCDPDYAEEILALYERDTDGVIGAVTGTHRAVAHGEDRSAVRRDMSRGARLRQRINTARVTIERRVAKDPLATIGWERKAAWQVPDWVDGAGGQPNCWVRGFRMSFRTEAVRRAGGFDETLRHYANFEDIHMGLAVARTDVIVQATRAKVFHLQAAGGRGSGRVRGATNIANRAYVVACHTTPGSEHRHRAARYGAYRCLLYALGSPLSAYNRESLVGAVAVLRRVRPLLLTPPERAADAYASLLTRAGVDFD